MACDGYGLYGENLGTAPDNNSGIEAVTYGFTGRELDPETGYYYYRARYYDPYSARFLTKDPIGLAGGLTNLYSYVGNNPVNLVDPTGLAGMCPLSADVASRRHLRTLEQTSYYGHPLFQERCRAS